MTNLPHDTDARIPTRAVPAAAAFSSDEIQQLSDEVLIGLAARAFVSRRLIPYPNWHFGIEEELTGDTDTSLAVRLSLWREGLRRRLEKPVVVEWHFGISLPLWLGNDISRSLFVGTCLEPNEMAYLMSVLGRDMVVLDGGANQGVYTLLTAGIVGPGGRVIAAEPSPREFEQLSLATRLNPHLPIQISPLALAESKGTASLVVADSEHSGQNTFGHFQYEGVSAVKTIDVQTVTIDELVGVNDLKRLDFIKLDIEGAEHRALLGGKQTLQTFKPFLLVEVSDPLLRAQGASEHDLIGLLHNFDYSPYEFGEAGELRPYRGPSRGTNIIALPNEAR
ncbi:MAG: FkbM family methyltransferase [Actinomycetota bacterium]|nr:FkbM family methyltransferase [Actinomycetota bacterium]